MTLEVGAAAETITVTGAGAAIETTSSTLSQTIENKRMVDLPLNGRNPFSLASLAPGVSPTSNNGGSSPSISGGRNATSEVAIDGVSNVNAENNVSILDLNYTPSVDAVQEFSVQTNSVSAEFGRLGGGVINLVTKSGSNTLRATAWEFARNSKMDATNFFTNRAGGKKGDFKRNQFGGNLGGPLNQRPDVLLRQLRRPARAERERVRRSRCRSPNGATATSRTSATRRVSTSSSTIRRRRGPIRRSPASSSAIRSRATDSGQSHQPDGARDDGLLAAAEHRPRPTRTPRPTTTRRPACTENRANRVDSRVDHNFSNQWRTFVRYSFSKEQVTPFNSFGNAASSSGGDGPTATDTHSLSFDHNYTLGSTWMLNVRYGLNRRLVDRLPISAGFDLASLGFPSNMIQHSRRLRVPARQRAELPVARPEHLHRSDDCADDAQLQRERDEGVGRAHDEDRQRLPEVSAELHAAVLPVGAVRLQQRAVDAAQSERVERHAGRGAGLDAARHPVRRQHQPQSVARLVQLVLVGLRAG